MKIDVRQLSALAAVIEEQSFEKAAMRLHLTQSAVSQRVKQLENTFGQALLVRTTPPLPTPAGAKLLGYHQQVSLLEAQLLQQMGKESEQSWQKLSVGINADSLSTWCFDVIQPFVKQHGLLLELRVDDQDQTHRLLQNGEVIGCISALNRPMQGCHCELLGVMVYHSMCSPEFKQQYFPKGVTRSAFMKAPAVHFDKKDQLQVNYLQRYWKINSYEYVFHQVPSWEPFVDFVLRGMAWGMVPDIQGRDLVARGQLVKLTPRKSLPVPLYWHVWNLNAPLVRELTLELHKAAKKFLTKAV